MQPVAAEDGPVAGPCPRNQCPILDGIARDRGLPHCNASVRPLALLLAPVRCRWNDEHQATRWIDGPDGRWKGTPQPERLAEVFCLLDLAFELCTPNTFSLSTSALPATDAHRSCWHCDVTRCAAGS